MPEITREQIIEAARSYIDVPYKQQGRSREHGLDCVGLIVMVGHDTGYTDFDFLEYGSNPDGETMERLLNEHLDRLPSFEDARAGDVVSMDFGDGEQHVGILTRTDLRGFKYSYMVHALRNHGVKEGRPFGAYLRGLKGVYQLRGLQ